MSNSFLRLLCVPATYEGMAPSLTREILSYGFSGIRTDVHPGDDELYHNWRWEQILSYKDTSAFVVFLLGGGKIDLSFHQLVAKTRDFAIKLMNAGYGPRENFAIEIGNEPDLAVSRWKKDARSMGECFRDCAGEIWERLPGTPVLSPSVSNLNRRGFGYLERMASYLPICSSIAFHRYPHGVDFETPHDGFSSRFEEMELLRDIADGRELWNTETGWAEWNEDYTLSQGEVADRIAREDAFFRAQGCVAWCPFQINSAVVSPEDKKDARREKTYGFRHPNGEWKQAAHRMREIAQGD